MRLQNLGYAVTAHRAQGITTDTSHVLVDSATTRENLYVGLTRGKQSNIAYVTTDRPDPHHTATHPNENPDATAHSVLYGVMQHRGAELSAHETITAEQEVWVSIAQLAAEYETIAQAAQHDRWARLLHTSGLTTEQTDDVLVSDAYGALSAELRRAEANHHDVDRLMPRLVQVRGFGDADDIAAVLHARLAHATVRPAGSGRTRKPARLIAGLIPEATGHMADDMRQALNERRDLIEKRADAVLDTAVAESASWITRLGDLPADAKRAKIWRRQVRIVAAYRDRYTITDDNPVGVTPESTAQKLDRARAAQALRLVVAAEGPDHEARPARQTSTHGLHL